MASCFTMETRFVGGSAKDSLIPRDSLVAGHLPLGSALAPVQSFSKFDLPLRRSFPRQCFSSESRRRSVFSGCCQLATAAVGHGASKSFNGLERNNFLGQGLLTGGSRSTNPVVKGRRRKLNAIAAVNGAVSAPAPYPPPPSHPPNTSNLSAEPVYVLDDISRYLYRKIKAALLPHLPPDFDAWDWLPDSIHDRVHKGESVAVFLVREGVHFSFFYILYHNADTICKFFYKLYMKKILIKEPSEEGYESSSFEAFTGPMRLVIAILAGTRFCHLAARVVKLDFGPGMTAKSRAIGLIVALTWFVFKWKALYVQNLVSDHKLDAPRIFAFDKVVSLLLYFVAASLIGEVTGFALRSLLAVGGFSGIALGLAAKEIVSNFFGGTVLFITRPFVIGESISAGKFSGFVQDIGFLQTRILSNDRVPMIVPNQNFINQVITNYSRAVNKVLDAEFPIRQQDIFLVDRITSRIVKYLRTHPDVDTNKATPICYLKSFNSMGLVIAVNCVLRPLGGSEFHRVKQTIFVRIADIIVSEGASLGSNSPFGSVIPRHDDSSVLDTENSTLKIAD